jgi:hypothetical protein
MPWVRGWNVVWVVEMALPQAQVVVSLWVWVKELAKVLIGGLELVADPERSPPVL